MKLTGALPDNYDPSDIPPQEIEFTYDSTNPNPIIGLNNGNLPITITNPTGINPSLQSWTSSLSKPVDDLVYSVQDSTRPLTASISSALDSWDNNKAIMVGSAKAISDVSNTSFNVGLSDVLSKSTLSLSDASIAPFNIGLSATLTKPALSLSDYQSPLATYVSAEPIKYEPMPRPLTREDVLDVLKGAMKEMTKEGVAEGIEQAVEKILSKLQKEEKDYNLKYHKRTIYFCGKEILIAENTNLEELCNLLFKDDYSKKRVWNCDEIVEYWGYEVNKENQRKAYTAGRKINEKVAMATTINNLLVVTTKTISINQHYLN